MVIVTDIFTAGLLNQFAWPVSMEKIGWRTYIIFTIWCAIQTVVVFFFIPETKNRTVSISTLQPTSIMTNLTLSTARGTRRNLQLQKPRRHIVSNKEARVRRVWRRCQHSRYLSMLQFVI